MSNLIPFQFESHAIQVIVDDDGEFHFIAKEVADVLGYSDAHKMCERLDEDEKQNRQIRGFGPRGVICISESGLYSAILGSNKPEAKPFKRWVTHEVLPTIRKTGGYATPNGATARSVPADAFKLVPMVVRAARALGLDKNSAAISANQVVTKMTGTNVLQLLGHTHLPSEQQVLVFTPSELGERLGSISGRKVNMLLAEAGLQARKGEHWVPLPAAEGFFRVLDTGKRHGDGTMIQQIKWAENVLSLIKQVA
jgi:prophage antirepressor-like protein